jgi:large subunit ribosomal protein L15
MKPEDIYSAGPRHRDRMRVGRGLGSGKGQTSGRGIKGHGARESYHGKLGFEGGQMPLFRRMPKRGFTNARFRVEYSVINVGQLGRVCQAGDEVSLEVLRRRGLIKSGAPRLKILGTGELGLALKVSAHAVSKSARAKLEAAGGAVELV